MGVAIQRSVTMTNSSSNSRTAFKMALQSTKVCLTCQGHEMTSAKITLTAGRESDIIVKWLREYKWRANWAPSKIASNSASSGGSQSSFLTTDPIRLPLASWVIALTAHSDLFKGKAASTRITIFDSCTLSLTKHPFGVKKNDSSSPQGEPVPDPTPRREKSIAWIFYQG